MKYPSSTFPRKSQNIKKVNEIQIPDAINVLRKNVRHEYRATIF